MAKQEFIEKEGKKVSTTPSGGTIQLQIKTSASEWSKFCIYNKMPAKEIKILSSQIENSTQVNTMVAETVLPYKWKYWRALHLAIWLGI